MQKLSNIFGDVRFSEIRRNCFYGIVDDTKVGVVLATMNPNYNTYALNRPDLNRLTDSKNTGRVDEAFIVAAKINGLNDRTYCGAMTVEETHEKLQALQQTPRQGRFGEFFVLPPTFFPPDDDVPF